VSLRATPGLRPSRRLVQSLTLEDGKIPDLLTFRPNHARMELLGRDWVAGAHSAGTVRPRPSERAKSAAYVDAFRRESDGGSHRRMQQFFLSLERR
jgi:hypothetical protein